MVTFLENRKRVFNHFIVLLLTTYITFLYSKRSLLYSSGLNKSSERIHLFTRQRQIYFGLGKHTIYRQINYIYIHYNHAPSTKDNIIKDKPIFPVWSLCGGMKQIERHDIYENIQLISQWIVQQCMLQKNIHLKYNVVNRRVACKQINHS